jgi:hypothetical protein
MTPLTLQDVLAHQASVPWPELYQVEQDLLLSLSMRAIFADPFLSGQVAMRGGTVLHKVHLAPASRYSEDIDLVVVGERPEGHIRKALMRVLRPVLGTEKSSAWATLLGRTQCRQTIPDPALHLQSAQRIRTGKRAYRRGRDQHVRATSEVPVAASALRFVFSRSAPPKHARVVQHKRDVRYQDARDVSAQEGLRSLRSVLGTDD